MAWKPNQNKALDTNMAMFTFYMNIYILKSLFVNFNELHTIKDCFIYMVIH